MRSIFLGMGCLLVVACGSYKGSEAAAVAGPAGDSDAGSGATNSGTADQNSQATTPIGGTPPSGIYVSSSMGSDSNAGAIDSPLKTLAKAFSVAKDQGMAVNACAEEFDEALTMIDGVSAYGYFDCTQKWVRGSARAKINSPTSPALTAKGIALATRLEGFEIDAPDLDGGPQGSVISSVALDVRDSQNLTFSAVLAHAGKGTPGADGTPAAENVATYASPVSGRDQFQPCPTGMSAFKPLFCTSPGAAAIISATPGGGVTCSAGATGGVGGGGGAARIYDNGVIPANAAMAPIDGGLGGGAAGGAGGTNGANGASGAGGASGTDGPNGQWQLTVDGFTVGNGTAGASGAGGSGGGGGGATSSFWDYVNGIPTGQPSGGYMETTSGAGGGAGGCGGQAGTPGTGGGASIGAFVIRSTVTFEQARLESSAGGRAGMGALGTAGTPGQTGGSGHNYDDPDTHTTFQISGDGGSGGVGGRGGASGHGAPGPSIALAYNGTLPTLTSTDLVPGPGGDGQPELDGTSTIPAVVGVSEAQHQIQ